MFALPRSICMRKLKSFLVIVIAICCYQTTFGQSCGGGNASFYVSDKNGIQQIKKFQISFHIVSENQDWRSQDLSKFGWKRQIFAEKRLEKYKKRGDSLELAFEIPPAEYSRLMKEREQILKKNPDSVVTKKIDRCDYYREKPLLSQDEPLTICIREGCSFMVVAEVQAEGYEIGYYISNFTCGCPKHYEFRLRKKRDKCCPAK